METSRFSPEPSPQEAAAVVAAIEQFMRDTAPVAVPETGPAVSLWQRTALAEGVARQPLLPAPWAWAPLSGAAAVKPT
jgi:hypothetical protein